MRRTGLYLTAAGMLLLTGCAHITTETGGTEQRQRTADITASQMRTDWATSIEAASPAQLGIRLADLIRRASSTYQDYGRQIAYNWREGNEGRGTPITGAEMQQQVPHWIAGQEPILKAYDDMVDFAVGRIRSRNLYDSGGRELIQEMVDQYYQLYSTVVYPKGEVGDYEFSIGALASRITGLVDRVTVEMERYP